MRWLAVALAAVLAAPLAPLAGGQPAPAGVEHGPSFLVYHAPGGREADPLASPLAPPPAGADRLPATFFDGATRADPAPENAPERALAHFREMQRLLLAKEATPAEVELHVEGELVPGALRVRVEANESISLSLVVFEHGVVLAGRPQPYVARFVVAPEERDELGVEARLDPSWDASKLGVVAIARRGGEVVQSATWTLAQDAPTHQRAKAVLVEHVTASWCDPCAPADEALALLATQRGAAGALSSGEVRYFRAPGWELYAGLALGAAAAVALAWGRRSA